MSHLLLVSEVASDINTLTILFVVISLKIMNYALLEALLSI